MTCVCDDVTSACYILRQYDKYQGILCDDVTYVCDDVTSVCYILRQYDKYQGITNSILE